MALAHFTLVSLLSQTQIVSRNKWQSWRRKKATERTNERTSEREKSTKLTFNFSLANTNFLFFFYFVLLLLLLLVDEASERAKEFDAPPTFVLAHKFAASSFFAAAAAAFPLRQAK